MLHSLTFLDVDKPNIKTLSQLKEQRKRQSSNETLKLKGKDRKLADFDSRIEERENCLFRKNFKKYERYTRTKMLKTRVEKENEYNAKNFTFKTSTLHGEELPSFYKVVKKDPNVLGKSNVFVRILNSNIMSSDSLVEDAPTDAFKQFKESCIKKQQLPVNPTHKKVRNTKNVKKTKNTCTRWSEKHSNHSRKGGRLFDNVKKMNPQKNDYDPLYSSFNNK